MDYIYYKLKYLIVDDFYSEVLLSKRPFNIAIEICRYGLYGYGLEDPFEEMVVLTELLLLKFHYNVELHERDYYDMDKILSIYESLDISKYLKNVSDLNNMEENINEIKKYLEIKR